MTVNCVKTGTGNDLLTAWGQLIDQNSAVLLHPLKNNNNANDKKNQWNSKQLWKVFFQEDMG